MGNTKSSSSWTAGRFTTFNNDNSQEIPLAMMAVARNAFLHRAHILSLRNAMFNYSDEDGMIKRDGFDKALNIAHLSNVEVFDLLFTMWDNAEDEKVSVKEFCVGTSPLACPFDDLPSIIAFAFRVGGDVNRGIVKRQELKDVLTGINSTASFFGDSHLIPEEIEAVLDTVFEGRREQTQEDCVRRLSINPYVKRFASGKPRARVQFKEMLVTKYMFEKCGLVTDYVIILDDIDALISSACKKNKNVEETEADYRFFKSEQQLTFQNSDPILSLDETIFESDSGENESTCSDSATERHELHHIDVRESRDDSCGSSQLHLHVIDVESPCEPLSDEREPSESENLYSNAVHKSLRRSFLDSYKKNRKTSRSMCDPPSRQSYSTYRFESSRSRDPPTVRNE